MSDGTHKSCFSKPPNNVRQIKATPKMWETRFFRILFSDGEFIFMLFIPIRNNWAKISTKPGSIVIMARSEFHFKVQVLIPMPISTKQKISFSKNKYVYALVLCHAMKIFVTWQNACIFVYVESVKSIHQYFHLFAKELLIQRFEIWDRLQVKGLVNCIHFFFFEKKRIFKCYTVVSISQKILWNWNNNTATT